MSINQREPHRNDDDDDFARAFTVVKETKCKSKTERGRSISTESKRERATRYFLRDSRRRCATRTRVCIASRSCAAVASLRTAVGVWEREIREIAGRRNEAKTVLFIDTK